MKVKVLVQRALVARDSRFSLPERLHNDLLKDPQRSVQRSLLPPALRRSPTLPLASCRMASHRRVDHLSNRAAVRFPIELDAKPCRWRYREISPAASAGAGA